MTAPLLIEGAAYQPDGSAVVRVGQIAVLDLQLDEPGNTGPFLPADLTGRFFQQTLVAADGAVLATVPGVAVDDHTVRFTLEVLGSHVPTGAQAADLTHAITEVLEDGDDEIVSRPFSIRRLRAGLPGARLGVGAPDRLVVRYVGAKGESAAQQAKDAGLIESNSPQALADWLRAPALEAAALATAAAEAANAVGSENVGAIDAAGAAKVAEVQAAGDDQVARVATTPGLFLYDTTLDALSNGILDVLATGAMTGGVAGIYDWATTGGAGTGGRGKVQVSGGAFTRFWVTDPGRGYTTGSPSTVTVAGAHGVTGATLTPVLAQNRTAGQSFVILTATGFQAYEVDAGGTTATPVGGVYEPVGGVVDRADAGRSGIIIGMRLGDGQVPFAASAADGTALVEGRAIVREVDSLKTGVTAAAAAAATADAKAVTADAKAVAADAKAVTADGKAVTATAAAAAADAKATSALAATAATQSADAGRSGIIIGMQLGDGQIPFAADAHTGEAVIDGKKPFAEVSSIRAAAAAADAKATAADAKATAALASAGASEVADAGRSGIIIGMQLGDGQIPFAADAHTGEALIDGRKPFAEMAILKAAVAAVLSPVADFPSDAIYCPGNSLSAAGSSGDWPSRLAGRNGRTVTFGGIGGQGARQIAARQGGVRPRVTLTGNQIPASGAVAVTAITWSPLSASSNTAVEIAGVPGVLALDGSGNTTFTRSTAGTVVAVPAGTPILVSEGQPYRNQIMITEIARNSFKAGTADFMGIGQILSAYRAMIDHLTPRARRAIIWSTPPQAAETTGTAGRIALDAVNAAVAAAFPEFWLDINSWLRRTTDEYIGQTLIQNPFAAAGISPTSQDTTDIANGVTPTSFLSDGLHFNANGGTAVAYRMDMELKLRGWA
ncbi:hypothetical protein GVN24_24715 [Rhizobium sp. CRIBSB]|nr:hypothetical protein [Rhizobium sp. CRIBSB]